MPPRCPPGFPGWPSRRGARGAWVPEGACCARVGRGGGPMGSGWVLRPVMGSVLSPPNTINSSAPSWERREQRGEGAGGHLQPPASPRCPSRGRAPTGCRRAGAAGRAAPKVWGGTGWACGGRIPSTPRLAASCPLWAPSCWSWAPPASGATGRVARGGLERGQAPGTHVAVSSHAGAAPWRGFPHGAVFPSAGFGFYCVLLLLLAPAPPAVPRGTERHPVPRCPAGSHDERPPPAPRRAPGPPGCIGTEKEPRWVLSTGHRATGGQRSPASPPQDALQHPKPLSTLGYGVHGGQAP